MGWYLCIGGDGVPVSQHAFCAPDSDCVPVALFEIEELWALTTQALTFSRTSEQHGGADGPAHKARKTRQDDEENNKGQRVILFTEPRTDINAGLVIILGSPLDFAEAAEEAGQLPHASHFFLARCCLGQVPGGAPFSQAE